MSENFEKHKETINSLHRQTKEELWTPQLATLLLLLVGILIATVFFNVAVFSFGHWAVALVVYIVEAIAPLVVLYRYRQKIYETVREKALAMDATDPGIYEACKEWQAKSNFGF